MRLRVWHLALLLALALAFTLHASAAYPTPPQGLAEVGRVTFQADGATQYVPVPSSAAAFCIFVTVTEPLPAWLDLGNTPESGYCGLMPAVGSTWELNGMPETYWQCTDPPDCFNYSPINMPTTNAVAFYGSASAPGSSGSAASSAALTEGTFTARIGKLETLANLVAGCALVMLFGFGYSIGRGAS